VGGGWGEHREGGVLREHDEGGDRGERGGLPWRSMYLPYLGGGSPHERIERRRDVDPQEATHHSSICRPGEEAEEEVVAGGVEGEETAGVTTRPGKYRTIA
jgi:hypothetical protein